MLPFAPSLLVRPFTPDEWEAAGAAVNALLLAAPYSAPLDESAMRQQFFAESPPTMLPTRWVRRQLLGAWRTGELVSVLDAAAGSDSENLLLGGCAAGRFAALSCAAGAQGLGESGRERAADCRRRFLA